MVAGELPAVLFFPLRRFIGALGGFLMVKVTFFVFTPAMHQNSQWKASAPLYMSPHTHAYIY
jgi:hypothetical protein